jgi:hypothetical protein
MSKLDINIYYKIVLSIFSLNLYLAYSQTADFIVTENPLVLHILNKYEQKISFREEKLFSPYCAVQIISREETLSDNFTPAIKVKLRNQTFYLLSDENNQALNVNNAGYFKIYSKVRILNDTEKVVKDNSVMLEPPHPEMSKKQYLPRGTRIKRIFIYRDRFYGQTLGLDSVYGWSDIRGKGGWEKDEIAVFPSPTIATEIVNRIRDKITNSNQTLRNLFEFFNIETNADLPIPQWQIDVSENKILCTLTNYPQQKHFQESTNHLINELEYILLGSKLRIESKQNKIVIAY